MGIWPRTKGPREEWYNHGEADGREHHREVQESKCQMVWACEDKRWRWHYLVEAELEHRSRYERTVSTQPWEQSRSYKMKSMTEQTGEELWLPQRLHNQVEAVRKRRFVTRYSQQVEIGRQWRCTRYILALQRTHYNVDLSSTGLRIMLLRMVRRSDVTASRKFHTWNATCRCYRKTHGFSLILSCCVDNDNTIRYELVVPPGERKTTSS